MVEADRQAGRQAGRQASRQGGRERERERERDRDREREKRRESRRRVGGDSGIRFGARCGTVATPARLGIQLTAARDTESVRRFLSAARPCVTTGITKGGCSRRIRFRPAQKLLPGPTALSLFCAALPCRYRHPNRSR